MFKLPGFLLYIDIKAAFYSVLRPLLYETGATEDGIARLVLLLDLPQSCIAPLLETLRQASALEQANLPKHAQALIASLYTTACGGKFVVIRPQRCPSEASVQVQALQILH